jgi:hypothetical protein
MQDPSISYSIPTPKIPDLAPTRALNTPQTLHAIPQHPRQTPNFAP